MLAVLVLASYWPGRFRERWVTADDFGNHSRDLPKPREGDITRRETLRALVRRGLGELRALLSEDTIERKSVGVLTSTNDPRERSTRLRHAPSPQVQAWFTRSGLDRLDPDTRRAFREQAYGLLGTVEEFSSALEEGVIDRLLRHGFYASTKEAASRAAKALENAATPHDKRVFQFALARADQGDYKGGRKRALPVLRKLADAPGPFRSPAEVLLHGRILIATALALAGQYVGDGEQDLDAARRYMSQARDLIPMDSHLERGELAMAEARLESMEGQRCAQAGAPDEAVRHRDNAELSILAAVNEWRLARRWDRMRTGIMRLRHMPGILKTQTADVERAKLLIPWLYALVKYQDAETPPQYEGKRPEVDRFEAHGLHKEILEAFNVLPPDIAAEALPIPAQEAFELLERCIVAFRNDEFNDPDSWRSTPDGPSDLLEPKESVLAVEHSAWFTQFKALQKERRGY